MAKVKVMSCLARTSMEWFKYIINNKLNNHANFWKPCEQNFHVLKTGGKMYFYDSNSKKFVGVATFNGTGNIKDVATAWHHYGVENGTNTLDSFKVLLSKESNTGEIFGDDHKICCIEVEDIKEFKVPIKYDYNKQQMFKKLFSVKDVIKDSIKDSTKDQDKISYSDELIKEFEEAETK